MLYHHFVDDRAFHSINEEILDRERSLQEALAVSKKFPNAHSEYVSEIPEVLRYFSDQVKFDKDIQIEFSRYWWSLHFYFFVEVPFANSSVKVYESSSKNGFSIWDIDSDFVGGTMYLTWINIDKHLLSKGYDDKFVKLVFNELIMLMSKPSINCSMKIVINNKREMPQYITNKLVFA